MFRILPLLIILLLTLMAMKLNGVFNNGLEYVLVKEFKVAQASDKKEEAPKPEKLAEEKKSGDEVKGDKKEEGEAKSEKNEDEKKAEHGGGEGGHGGAEKADPNTYSERPKEQEFPKYSEIEVGVLQSLGKRRQELDERENSILLKENSLQVIDKNIQTRIDELKKLQAEVQGVLDEYNKKQDEKIMNLVKIYENMKPTEAAKIFDELQMGVLLKVAQHMKEAKLASILAKMDPNKARELTIELVDRKRSDGSSISQ
jgi:flagellar motility protein MotE (MotC chaperone)